MDRAATVTIVVVGLLVGLCALVYLNKSVRCWDTFPFYSTVCVAK